MSSLFQSSLAEIAAPGWRAFESRIKNLEEIVESMCDELWWHDKQLRRLELDRLQGWGKGDWKDDFNYGWGKGKGTDFQHSGKGKGNGLRSRGKGKRNGRHGNGKGRDGKGEGTNGKWIPRAERAQGQQ